MQQQQRKGLRFIIPLLLLAGCGLMAFSYHLAKQQSRINASGLRAPGHVISLQSERSDDDTVYYPVVSIDFATGPLQFRDRAGSNPPSYHVGETVTVLYLTSNPSGTAMIDRGRRNWLPAALTGLFGALFVICAVLCIRGTSPERGDAAVDSPSATS